MSVAEEDSTSELTSLEDGISANSREHQRYETRSLHSPPGSVDSISDENKGDSEYDDKERRSDESEDSRNSGTSEKTDDVTYSKLSIYSFTHYYVY